MTVSLPPAPRRRHIGLTPMIDVVFLLLIFFMVAARFGGGASLPVAPGQAGDGAWTGPPRLVEVGAQALWLNGRSVTAAGLPGALAPLVEDPQDIVVLRPRAGADVGRLVSVIEALRAAGFARVVVVE